MSGSARQTIVVASDAAGERLDRFLAAHLSSRSTAQRAIENGRVQVDEVARPNRYVLRGGEVITVTSVEPVRAGNVATAQFSIRFEDKYLLVIDKPAGVVVHPASAHPQGTLVQALRQKAAGGPDQERPGIVHRLDRNTSGLLVVARSDESHQALKKMLQKRLIKREYSALIAGHPPAQSGTIDAPLGRDRRHRTKVSIDSEYPKVAITHFEVQQLLAQSALLRVWLETGRTHQIRAHFAAIGHSIIGDPQYGQAPSYGLDRQFLHAARLAFTHPFADQLIDIESPLPEDLANALKRAQAQ